jgi:hypothetical protein
MDAICRTLLVLWLQMWTFCEGSESCFLCLRCSFAVAVPCLNGVVWCFS